MDIEIQALIANNIWIYTTLPTCKKAIGFKWVYKTKSHVDRSSERHKARLVAKGFTQIACINFFHTFSPVAKLTTVRLLLALTYSLNIHFYQLDVHNSFLHEDLDEVVYTSLPKGITPSYPNQVCKLYKFIYGLKQSSRQWFEKLSTVMLSTGFKQCPVDHSFFNHQSHDSFTALLIYVDELVLAGNNLDMINKVKATLQHHFHIKDLGPLKYFLGLEVARNNSGIKICQQKYTLWHPLQCWTLGMQTRCHPYDKRHKADYQCRNTFRRSYNIPQVCWTINLLAKSRLVIPVQQLSQHMSNPTNLHHQAAIRVLHYLKNSPAQGLFFPSTSTLHLKAFSDSDWATCPITRKSMTSYCIYLGESIIL